MDNDISLDLFEATFLGSMLWLESLVVVWKKAEPGLL